MLKKDFEKLSQTAMNVPQPSLGQHNQKEQKSTPLHPAVLCFHSSSGLLLRSTRCFPIEMAIYSDALFDDDDLISIINAMHISDRSLPFSTTSPHPRPSAVTPPVQPIGTLSTSGWSLIAHMPTPQTLIDASGSHALSQTDNCIYDVSSGRETGIIKDW
jgi:hypothetical protein